MERVEAVVIGAGVVGLAVARALALDGREVLVLERAGLIGSETSSRNSEVIHAGLYYPNGSVKARVCVSGKEALYDYCERFGVGHKRCEKLVVATQEDQLPALKALGENAGRNGVETRLLSSEEARALEPELHSVGALLSPSTGIVDSHGLMLAYQGEIEAAGGFIAFHAPVERIARDGAGFRIETGGPAPSSLGCDLLVNSAGLYAVDVARAFEGLPQEGLPRMHFARGHYFTLQGASPFKRLIYPMPADGVLGVHITLDLAGQARFGPDLQWIERPDDYDLDPRRAEVFYEAVRHYWPGLRDGSLSPAYCGIRPKIHGPGEPQPDFRIDGPREHGIPGLVNLFGIESPGLTSSLAIGEMVSGLLRSA